MSETGIPDKTTADQDAPRLGEAAKWLAGSIPVAVAVLTFVGLSGDELGRAIRMFPMVFVAGVVVLVVAVTAGVIAIFNTKRARAWLTLGIVSFAIGVAILTTIHAAATSEQDRPTVTVGLGRAEQDLTAEVTISAEGLKPEDYVFVVVQGANSQRRLDENSAAFAEDQSPIPPREYSKQRLYSGRIGGAPDGRAASTFKLPLAQGLYELLIVQAGILTGSAEDQREDEDAMMSSDPKTGAFKCGPETTNMSCITVLLPTPPAPAAPPTG